MSSGSTYDVNHPDSCMVARQTLVVGIYEPGRSNEIERFATLSVLHISDLQDLPMHIPS
jgi:hypothetical protein